MTTTKTALCLLFGVAIGIAPAHAVAQAPSSAATPGAAPGSPSAATPPAAPAATPAPLTPGASGPTSGTVAQPRDATGAAAAQVDLAAPPPSEQPSGQPSEQPSTDDRLTSLEARMAGTDESLGATRAIADKLNKLKTSGYVQGRYEWHDDSANGLRPDGTPANLNRFFVRRGRLKLLYEGTNAEYMLQIDASGSGVALRDAEATFVDTWTPFGLRLTVGQFKWPFGHEILQSSADREMPERALVFRRLFPGERDRGLRLQARYKVFKLAVALVNGLPQGIGDRTYTDFDANSFKDLVGRVGIDVGFLTVGLSGYYGRHLQTTPATAFSVSGSDSDMDGTISATEVMFRAATPASYRLFRRVRGGADMQLYSDIEGIGGLALKGEFVVARDTNLAYGTAPADPCRDQTSLGWVVTAVQNIGDFVSAVVRIDSFDPNYSSSLDAACTTVAGARGDRVTTYGGGLLLHASGNLKATFAYEHIAEQKSRAVANDVFTAQLQARF